MTTYIQTSPGQFISQPNSLVNNLSTSSINPQLLTSIPSGQLLANPNSSYGSTTLLSSQGGQFILASRNVSGSSLSGYPSVLQSGPPTFMLSPQTNSNESLIGQQLLPTIQPAANPMIPLLLSNGQMITAGLSNPPLQSLQSAGLGQYFGNNFIQTGISSSISQPATQFLTNGTGQLFAITPSMINGITQQQQQPQQQQAAINSLTQQQSPSAYIQVLTPNGIALIPSNQIVSSQSVNQINSCANQPEQVQQLFQAATYPQQIQQKQENNNVSLSIKASNVGQEKAKCIMASESSNESTNSLAMTKTNNCSEPNQTNQAIQVTISSKSSNRLFIAKSAEIKSPNQSTVSSTTCYNKTNDSKSNSSDSSNQTILIDNSLSPIFTSVESQTNQSPTPPISAASPMEPESTTHSTATVAHTINNTDASIVDGVNLEEIKEFARQFKLRRLSLGLTQTQVGQALSATEGPSYSQSAICRFEKLDITPKSAQKIKPVLEKWMDEAEERCKSGTSNLTDFIGNENNKKRKRRTSFTPSALEALNAFFEKNTHPSSHEMTELADKLRYDREVVRVWFCNKRQTLRNNVKKLEPLSSSSISFASSSSSSSSFTSSSTNVIMA